jgi:exo-1,4-beta-D-glucosaminidase
MKMDGPYSWEPPVLWWDTSRAGSAFGTTAEEGTESPPPLESLQKFIGPTDLWPIGTVWNYHAGKPKSVFDNISRFTDGVNNRYGSTGGVADYAKKSEVMNYENTRSFFEAWNAGENATTFGTIFWMLNGVWPSVHWNLYDWYYEPGGGFFGTKKANEPVHIAYDYFDGKVFVYNSTLTARSGMTATATLYNIPDLTQKYTTGVTNLMVPADASTNVFTIPPVSGLSYTYFIRLQLRDSTGALVSDNLYWYSTSPDKLGKAHTWWKTAIHRYANLTGLNSLALNSDVTASVSRTVSAGQETGTITLDNTSTTNIAFFLRPEIVAGNGGTEVLPIEYSDNYVSLFPGEATTITATYATADLGGQAPYLLVRGYNVPTTSMPVP